MQILTRFNKVIAHSEHGYIPVGNTAVCAETNECYDEAVIVTVECVPTDISQYDYYYVNGKFIKGGDSCIPKYQMGELGGVFPMPESINSGQTVIPTYNDPRKRVEFRYMSYSTPIPGNIPCYHDKGALVVGETVKDNDAASKKYVDDIRKKLTLSDGITSGTTNTVTLTPGLYYIQVDNHALGMVYWDSSLSEDNKVDGTGKNLRIHYKSGHSINTSGHHILDEYYVEVLKDGVLKSVHYERNFNDWQNPAYYILNSTWRVVKIL